MCRALPAMPVNLIRRPACVRSLPTFLADLLAMVPARPLAQERGPAGPERSGDRPGPGSAAVTTQRSQRGAW